MKEATAQLAQYPETGPVDTDGSRRLLLLPFPYSLVYYIEGGEVVVVAVAHTSQEPGYWSHR